MFIFKWLFVILVACAIFFSNVLMADDAPKKNCRMEEVVVTATKTPKKLENIPAVVTVIGQDEIESAPARTVGDLLTELPGVFPSEPQGVGIVTPQTVTVRGNGFTGHTLVLLDGQRMNTPSNDYAYLTAMPVRAVDRIEVIRGPFSALYGSSGGGGIINIITKNGGEKSYVQPFGKAGDFGRYDYGMDAGFVQGQFSLGLFYDHKEADNYYLYDDKGIDDTNREYSHDRFHAKLTGTIHDTIHLSLSGGMVDCGTDFGIGENLGVENHKDFVQPYVNFQVDSYITQKFQFKGQMDWLGSDNKYLGETLVNVTYPDFGPPIPSFNYSSSMNDTDSERYRGDFTLNCYFSDTHTMTIGSEVIYTEYDKQIYSTETGELLEVQGREGQATDKDDTMFSLYAQYDGIFLNERLEFVLGARFDDYESFGSEISPKGTVRFQYADGGNLKFSVGKGFRAPNLNQLYSAPWSISAFIVNQGNPDLEAETMISYEFSVEQYALNHDLFFRLTPYYTEADNFITSIREPDPINPDGQVMHPENVDEVEIKGTDVEFSYRVVQPITFFANYNFNETKDKNTDEILNGYAKHHAVLGVRGNGKITDDFRCFGSWSARYTGEYDESSWGRTTVTKTVGDYWIQNASLGLSFREWVAVKLDVFNLVNDRSETGIDDYPAKLNVLAEVSVKYEF